MKPIDTKDMSPALEGMANMINIHVVNNLTDAQLAAEASADLAMQGSSKIAQLATDQKSIALDIQSHSDNQLTMQQTVSELQTGMYALASSVDEIKDSGVGSGTLDPASVNRILDPIKSAIDKIDNKAKKAKGGSKTKEQAKADATEAKAKLAAELHGALSKSAVQAVIEDYMSKPSRASLRTAYNMIRLDNPARDSLLILSGEPSGGKSWVAKQIAKLHDVSEFVSYDMAMQPEALSTIMTMDREYKSAWASDSVSSQLMRKIHDSVMANPTDPSQWLSGCKIADEINTASPAVIGVYKSTFGITHDHPTAGVPCYIWNLASSDDGKVERLYIPKSHLTIIATQNRGSEFNTQYEPDPADFDRWVHAHIPLDVDLFPDITNGMIDERSTFIRENKDRDSIMIAISVGMAELRRQTDKVISKYRNAFRYGSVKARGIGRAIAAVESSIVDAASAQGRLDNPRDVDVSSLPLIPILEQVFHYELNTLCAEDETGEPVDDSDFRGLLREAVSESASAANIAMSGGTVYS